MKTKELLNTNEYQELRSAFYQLEKEYRPYFDLLVKNQGKKYTEFRGGVTLDGYLNYNPDILLIAYNPEHGLHREWEYDKGHLVNMGERPFSIFQRWNARKNGEWWEIEKKRCNRFPANIIELLFSYEEALGKDIGHVLKTPHKWVDHIEKKIMVLNLYPFGTKHGKELQSMFKKMIDDSNFTERDAYTAECTEWDVRKHFVKLMRDFIFTYIKPKSIVCLGVSTISDFTYGEYHKLSGGLYESNENKKIIGINRRGNWTTRAKEAGKKVAELVHKV
jgi:hypothetical protein